MIFNLEEDQIPENSITQTYLNTHSTRLRQKSPSRNRIQTVKQRHVILDWKLYFCNFLSFRYHIKNVMELILLLCLMYLVAKLNII